MKKITLLIAAALVSATTLFAQEKTDVLTVDLFSEITRDASYTDVSLTTEAGTTYVGNIARNKGVDIQLRTSSNSGLVTTASAGNIKSITVEWSTETETNSSRVLEVYGKNEAYTNISDLYGNAAAQGTEIASFAKSAGNQTLTIDGQFQYIGFRSNSGAMYINKITIVWEAAATEEIPATGITIDETLSLEQYKYGVAINATLAPENTTDFITWASDNEAVATVDAAGKVTALTVGTANITATAREGVSATCAVTVTAPTVLTCAQASTIALAVANNNDVAEGGKYVIRGYVTEVFSNAASNLEQYGNYSCWLADEKDGENVFEAYQVAPTDGETLVAVGDYVEVIGDLTKYGTTPETVGRGAATISVLSDPSTALDNTTIETKAAKRFINGVLVIEKDGVLYNAQGARL